MSWKQQKKQMKRMKRPKDPNAPKRPCSAFFLFQREIRPELKKQNPEYNNRDIEQEVSDQWKDIPADLKESYRVEARQLKEAYRRKMNEYSKRAKSQEFQRKLFSWNQQKKETKKRVRKAARRRQAMVTKYSEPKENNQSNSVMIQKDFEDDSDDEV